MSLNYNALPTLDRTHMDRSSTPRVQPHTTHRPPLFAADSDHPLILPRASLPSSAVPYVATVVTALYQNPYIVPDPNLGFDQQSGLYAYYNNMQLISMGYVSSARAADKVHLHFLGRKRTVSIHLKLKDREDTHMTHIVRGGRRKRGITGDEKKDDDTLMMWTLTGILTSRRAASFR